MAEVLAGFLSMSGPRQPSRKAIELVKSEGFQHCIAELNYRRLKHSQAPTDETLKHLDNAAAAVARYLNLQ